MNTNSGSMVEARFETKLQQQSDWRLCNFVLQGTLDSTRFIKQLLERPSKRFISYGHFSSLYNYAKRSIRLQSHSHDLAALLLEHHLSFEVLLQFCLTLHNIFFIIFNTFHFVVRCSLFAPCHHNNNITFLTIPHSQNRGMGFSRTQYT